MSGRQRHHGQGARLIYQLSAPEERVSTSRRWRGDECAGRRVACSLHGASSELILFPGERIDTPHITDAASIVPAFSRRLTLLKIGSVADDIYQSGAVARRQGLFSSTLPAERYRAFGISGASDACAMILLLLRHDARYASQTMPPR